jgi:glucose-6-phosphate 1-dehydrogenase
VVDTSLSSPPDFVELGEEVELVVRHHSGDKMSPYGRPLSDAVRGDASLFAREDSVEAAWRLVDPILGNVTLIHEYEPNTRGSPKPGGSLHAMTAGTTLSPRRRSDDITQRSCVPV